MPVAQKSGKLLAQRIYEAKKGEMSKDQILGLYNMDYSHIPTTIFSTNEYSYIGKNEEEAIKERGEEHIEIYQKEVTPLESSICSHSKATAFMKVICDKEKDDLVIGMHYLGPSAGEVINGFALGMKLGMRKVDLDDTVGIHPTVSENMLNLDVTKKSGESFEQTDC